MKCAKVDCEWGEVPQTDPCSVCGRQVHHICSNDIYDGGELSKRRQCVRKFFSTDSDSQEFTPSSTSDISRSSQDAVIDLSQAEPDNGAEIATDIPLHARPKNATNWIWDYVHRLEETVMHNGAEYTHICLLCLQQNEWKDSLCRARHTSNAKDHLVSIHREHEWAIKEQEHRSNRTKRLEVKVSPKEEAKRSAEPDDHAQQPDKRQKKLSWEAPVSKDKVSGHIVRWLIHDGLPRNLTTTPAFKEFLAGVTGKSDVTIPSHRTYNAILDNHYSTFKKNVAALISEEFKEVFP
ncbi:hypothetical protein F442_11442 [Phytophthora nicotianae P10297]|uniref:BED-type domain-containing protein n=1 Tax=Phytophthora nicotianae P10297 TaxID=1317064 RepID=W2Z584_PHYNI|nr:hypothetical protein F442_11442 [Phytophthora nicotianae P10297]